MIGKTIFKIRSSSRNPENKDLSLRALVLVVLFIAISLHSSETYSQTATGAKSKAPPAAAADVDDNGDDTEDTAEKKNTLVPTTAEADDNSDSEGTTDEKVASPNTPPAASPQATVQSSEQPSVDTLEPAEPAMEETVDNSEPPMENQETLTTEQPPVETVPQDPPPIEEAPTPPPVPVVEETPLQHIPPPAEYVEVIPKEKIVEIEPRKTYTTNYRDRRTRHGFTFDFNAENLYFPEYTSIIDGALYEDMFGQEDVTLLQASFGYKFNFALGALSAGLSYGQGTLVDDRSVDASEVPQERLLTISKKAINVQWTLDTLMKEPYFVPYVGMSYWQLGLTEENVTQGLTEEHDTGYGTSFTIGFLVQLNWLDKESSRVAYLEQGLENTYLNVFWTQYQDTGDELDPILANEFNFGVGLRLEF